MSIRPCSPLAGYRITFEDRIAASHRASPIINSNVSIGGPGLNNCNGQCAIKLSREVERVAHAEQILIILAFWLLRVILFIFYSLIACMQRVAYRSHLFSWFRSLSFSPSSFFFSFLILWFKPRRWDILLKVNTPPYCPENLWKWTKKNSKCCSRANLLLYSVQYCAKDFQ